MRVISFFHTADIHFGVENYGRVDPVTGIHTRLLDFKQSLATCIDQAIEHKIDLFIFAGDAYKTAYPTPTQQRLLLEQFLRLHEANIPVVIVVGNHDHPLSFGKANALDIYHQLPLDGFVVFSRIEAQVVETKHGPVQVVGVPWPTRNAIVTRSEARYKTTEELTQFIASEVKKQIKTVASTLDQALPTILIGHLTVSNGIFSGSEKCAVFGSDPLFDAADLALPGIDYVALGHLHRYQQVNTRGKTPVVYAGSIDRVDFGERRETKGYVRGAISVSPHRKHTVHEFVPLTTRPFVHIEVSLTLRDQQTDELIAQIKQHDIDDAIVKIVYHVPGEVKDSVDLEAVQRACRSAMYVASITPVHTSVQRTRRAAAGNVRDIHTLVDSYIEGNETLREKKERLIKKANQLYESSSS